MERPVVVCDLAQLRGTPVFAVQALGQKWKRVFGAKRNMTTGVWLFPAFYPYCSDVVRDLQIVEPELVFTSEATNQIQHCTALVGLSLDTPSVPNNKYKPVLQMFQHQKEGFEFAQRMLRCALFFDMGLGKTKIVYDVIRNGGWKTLVLVPSVGLGMWAQEAAVHAPELTIARLEGSSPLGKRVARERTKERKELKKQIEAEEDKDKKAASIRHLESLAGPTRAAKMAEVVAAAEEADVLVTTYDTAKLYQPYIFDHFDYNVIVADESHNLRSPKTARTKAALALASKAFRRIILTGTPSLGNPMHLYGQLAFLGSSIPAKSQWVFRKHHIIFARGSNKIQVGYKNLDLLNEKVQRIALVRTKEECLDLPARVITDIPFTVSGEQKKLYNGLIERAVVELSSGTLYAPDSAMTALQKLLQTLSGFIIVPPPPVCDNCPNVRNCVAFGIKPYTPNCKLYPDPWPRKIRRLKENPKLVALLDLLDGIPEEKVIIWAYFTEELNIVQEALEARGTSFIRIDGSNSRKAAAESVRFNADPKIKVWLAQVSTGVALTLTAAAYTIYYGLTYSLDAYLQSMDRNYRIGQKRATFVYRLLCQKSVLEFVAKSLSAKQDLAKTLTTKIDCILCERNTKCLRDGIEPFEKGCKYKSKATRVITKPGVL